VVAMGGRLYQSPVSARIHQHAILQVVPAGRIRDLIPATHRAISGICLQVPGLCPGFRRPEAFAGSAPLSPPAPLVLRPQPGSPHPPRLQGHPLHHVRDCCEIFQVQCFGPALQDLFRQ
jgi:hypothetical protein